MPNNSPNNNKTVKTVKTPRDPKLSINNFENLTLEEQHQLVDIIMSDLKKVILGSYYLK